MKSITHIKSFIGIAASLVLCLPFFGCVEEFEIEPETFEPALIVEASLTNIVKQHEVHLSNARPLGAAASEETEATVSILEDGTTTYNFNETSPGVYRSTTAFGAEPGKTYQLQIITSGGKSYLSDAVTIAGTSELAAINAEVEQNAEDLLGISVTAENENLEGISQYFRYAYEETYAIVAPLWNPDDIVITSEDPPSVGLIPKQQEEQTCYRTQKSTDIIITSTNGLSENQITGFPIRFISSRSHVTRYRYSILVKQYVISADAYSYLENLKNLSGPKGVFSASQPGFFGGNIFSQTDRDEKVIGFFEVSYETSKRIFFNHDDFFGDSGIIPALYVTNCQNTEIFPFFDPSVPGSEALLFDAIRNNNYKFLRDNGPFPPEEEGRYVLTIRACGDCTVYGSNVKPDFWID